MLDAYNDPARWTDAGIYRAPLFDCHSFQRKLDRICGLSPSGNSIVRLRWAWDCRKWENTAWDEFGNATGGEFRQKYRALTIEIGDNEYVDISPPRWILEERFEPEQIAASWEATRYRVEPKLPLPLTCRNCHSLQWIDPYRSSGIEVICIVCNQFDVLPSNRQDVWGPAPREGWYNLLPYIGIIAEHSNKCCQRLWEESREICYGEYKEPNGLELKRLKKAISKRNKEAATNPHVSPELDEVALKQAKEWGLQEMKETQIERRQELKEMYRDEVLVHGPGIIPPEAIAALKESGRRVPVARTIFS